MTTTKRAAFVATIVLFGSMTLAPAQAPDAAEKKAIENATLFMNRLIAGEYEKAGALLDAKMSEVAGPPKLRQLWESLAAKNGPFRGLGKPTVTAKPSFIAVVFPATWSKAELNVRIVIDAEGKVTGLWLDPVQSPYDPPDYVNRDSFREEEVRVGSEPWVLPGTLSIPKMDGKTKVPGVVLVHGSGPNDRDEHVGNCYPFRDIAWGLASNGIAVLRYDKRTLVHGPRFITDPGFETIDAEVIDDAVLALALLRERPEIDAKRVYLLGHSLGATFAPAIALRKPGPAGVVMLAPFARDLEDLMRYQFKYLAELEGTTVDANPTLQQTFAALDRLEARSVDPEERVLGARASYWYDLMDRDGEVCIQQARQLECPVLILRGTRDYQIPTEDFHAWRKALSGHRNFAGSEMMWLNHLFVIGTGPSTPAEYQEAGHVDASVIKMLTEWIKSHERN